MLKLAGANVSTSHGRLFADAVFLFVLFGWTMTAWSLPTGVFPSPLDVGKAALELAGRADFWWNAGATASRVVFAVAVATLIGTTIGLLPRYLPLTGGIVDDVLAPFLSAFPGIAWAILGTVWFGVTPRAVLVVQILIILPFALVNVAEGAKQIGSEPIEMARSFTRRRIPVFWRVELPYLIPFIMAAARISYGVCWKISLIAELFGAHSGIGYMMQMSQDLGAVDQIVSLCFYVVLFVMVGERLVLDPISHFFEDRSGLARV